jgi:hypothetical protein
MIAGQLGGKWQDPLAYISEHIEPYLQGLPGQQARDSGASTSHVPHVPHEAARLLELIQKLNVSPVPARQQPGAVDQHHQHPAAILVPDAADATLRTAAFPSSSSSSSSYHPEETEGEEKTLSIISEGDLLLATPPPDSDGVEQGEGQNDLGHDSNDLGHDSNHHDSRGLGAYSEKYYV